MPSPLREWGASIFYAWDIPRHLFPFVLKAHVYDGVPAGFPSNLSLSWGMWAFGVLRWELIFWIWNLKVLELQEPVSSPSKPGATGSLKILFFLNWEWSQIGTGEGNFSLIEPFQKVRTLFKSIKMKRRELKTYKINDKDLKCRQ